MRPGAAEQPPEGPRPSIPDWRPRTAPSGPVEPTPRLPLVVPSLVVQPLPATLDEAMLLRRIVAVTGSLDAERATETAARLLHLDALDEGDITVRLDCADADVNATLMLVDTFGSLRAKVHVVVVGQAVGAAVVVVAAADSASMYPHARIVLTEPTLPSIDGDASHVDARLAEQRRVVQSAYDVVARRCGRSRDEVEHDARRRVLLTAAEAVDYGLVDNVE